MKRFIAAAVMLLMILPCAVFNSESSLFYCEYTPKTATGSIFYIDIYTRAEISAAVLELSYSGDTVEYRSASAVSTTSSLRSRDDSGVAHIAMADSGAVSGHICRVSFKALRSGSCDFKLHIVQYADADRKLASPPGDYTLSVKPGKDDISTDTSSRSSKGSSSLSGRKSGSLSEYNSIDQPDGDTDDPEVGVFDIRRNSPLKYILIGAGIVILIGALVGAGVFIGRRSLMKKSDASVKEDEDSESE